MLKVIVSNKPPLDKAIAKVQAPPHPVQNKDLRAGRESEGLAVRQAPDQTPQSQTLHGPGRDHILLQQKGIDFIAQGAVPSLDPVRGLPHRLNPPRGPLAAEDTHITLHALPPGVALDPVPDPTLDLALDLVLSLHNGAGRDNGAEIHMEQMCKQIMN